MPVPLFDHPVIPVASTADANATTRAVRPYLEGTGDRITLVHVVEKAGGALDKASVEQRETDAERIFDVAREELADTGTTVETEIVYGTNVAEAIVDTATDIGASAIVFTPRGGSKWVKLLTGDVAESLGEQNTLPVVTLPDRGEDDG